MNKISHSDQTQQGQTKLLTDSSQDGNYNKPNLKLYQFDALQLKEIIEKYRQRKYVDDLDYIKAEFTDRSAVDGGVEEQAVTDLLDGIDVNPDIGIATEQLAKREKAFGSHYKEPPERTSYFTLLWEQLQDFMLRVLIVCAIFAIVVDMSFATPEERGHAWIEGAAILIAVVVVSNVTAWSDYTKEGNFLEQQLIEENGKTVTCMRDSKEQIVHRNFLKVGDIIKIQTGMNVPVDGLIISGVGVMCDESSMTGESDHLAKESFPKCLNRQKENESDEKFQTCAHTIPSPILLSGTQIQTGQGWFICLVVGDNTCENQILAAIEKKSNEQTPLQQKLDKIATDIGKLGMYCAILIIHALIIRNFLESMIRREFDFMGGELTVEGRKCTEDDITNDLCVGFKTGYIKEWLGYIIIGVAIVVVAVPEGLPLAVMISLAYSVSKMLKDNNFVKKLSSCEIMGGANNICSDKTGTLTKNKMTWCQIWAGKDFAIQDPDSKKQLDYEEFLGTKFSKDLLAQAVSCNTTGNAKDAGATEIAMIKFITRCDVDFQFLRQKYLPKDLLRFPFDSSRKRMSTIVELEEDEECEHDYPFRMHTKGASEIVLATCTHYLDWDGKKQVLDLYMLRQLDKVITKYAKNALRTIAFAYKDLKEDEGGANHEDKQEGSKIYQIEEGGLTLIAIAGIKDIIRDEVPEAVGQCNNAGVRVRMVTGDNLTTAIAIAIECGILSKEDDPKEECVCMEGPEFNEFVGSLVDKDTKERIFAMGKEPGQETIGNIENMKKVRNKLKVLARSRPNDKYIMVSGLKQLGDIVAVTGDGTNDAPALKKADVGFAMKTGTQVAHSAADIIIQDDNFASIIKACKWGRNVFDNIRSFLQFQLTVNVVALTISFIGSVIMWESPLQAIQLLWVNLIMDSLASLALATEEPQEALLQRPPYRKSEYIISQKMTKHILGMSFYQCIILFTFVFGGPQFIPEEPDDYITKELIASHPNPAIRDWDGQYVLSGMVKDIDGQDVYRHFETNTPSRHFTVIFNLFVFLQIFNMITARKINDEWNIFSGLLNNYMFMGVLLTIIIGQILIVQQGGWAMKVHRAGLTQEQWKICLLISCTVLFVNWFMKCVPDKFFPIMGDEDPAEVINATNDYEMLKRRKIRDSSDNLKQYREDRGSQKSSKRNSAGISPITSPHPERESGQKPVENSLQQLDHQNAGHQIEPEIS